MARQTTCARCGTTVAIRDGSDIQTLSCPRCLAPLAGQPTTAIQTTPSGTSNVTESLVPGPSPYNVSTSAVRSLDIQADDDSKRSLGCISILIVMTIVGIGLALIVPRGGLDREGIGAIMLIVALFSILDVLVIIQIGVWLKHRSARFPSHGGREGFIKAVTMFFAFVGLALAAVVFFFFACFGTIMIAAK